MYRERKLDFRFGTLIGDNLPEPVDRSTTKEDNDNYGGNASAGDNVGGGVVQVHKAEAGLPLAVLVRKYESRRYLRA